MTTVDEIATHYVREKAEHDPVWATAIGIPGFDDRFGDYSPDGVEAQHDLARRTLAAVHGADMNDDAARIAADLMIERLTTGLALDEVEWFRSLNSLGSPLQSIRRVFDLMPTQTAEDWATFAARLAAVPDALAGYRRTLEVGIERGETASARQAETCRQQAATFAGTMEGVPPFTMELLGAHERAGSPASDLPAAAQKAIAAFAAFEGFLGEDYLPAARTDDAVGAERYQRYASFFTGAILDLADLEAWGWTEIRRLRREMQDTAAQILPGGSVEEVTDLLESDPERAIEGGDQVIAWLQDLLDRTVTAMDGTHFEIPDPIKALEVRQAPPGGPPVAYYTGPNEDFSRPGRYWFPAADRTHFPLWQEVSIAYHEGVPGHHLEIATQQYQRDRLNRFQSTTRISGYSEGWALYAERLMDELGFFDNPDYRLGMLAGQMFRAMRIVVDIGLHLARRIPSDADFSPGAAWTPEVAREFIGGLRFLPVGAVDGEITRYLGLPGQAISYKAGERVWRRSRGVLQQRQGRNFSLTAFHARALSMGAMGLDQLERELTRDVSAQP